jgi:hypothetical protein
MRRSYPSNSLRRRVQVVGDMMALIKPTGASWKSMINMFNMPRDLGQGIMGNSHSYCLQARKTLVPQDVLCRFEGIFWRDSFPQTLEQIDPVSRSTTCCELSVLPVIPPSRCSSPFFQQRHPRPCQGRSYSYAAASTCSFIGDALCAWSLAVTTYLAGAWQMNS